MFYELMSKKNIFDRKSNIWCRIILSNEKMLINVVKCPFSHLTYILLYIVKNPRTNSFELFKYFIIKHPKNWQKYENREKASKKAF
jgi:hypothetical protein